jgi:hypothetical protein
MSAPLSLSVRCPRADRLPRRASVGALSLSEIRGIPPAADSPAARGVHPPHPSLPGLGRPALLILAALAAAPAGASTLPVIPHVFADGSTLVDLAAENLDPERYDPWKGAKVAPVIAPAVAYAAPRKPLPCRPQERLRPENWRYCGTPVAAVAGPGPFDWFWPEFGGGGSGGGSCCAPAPKPPAPVPAPGALGLILAALAALGLLRRARA